MKAAKLILFIALAPLFIPCMGFLGLIQGIDKHGKGWYDRVWTEGNMFEIALAVLIGPLYLFCTGFLWAFEKPWEGLLE